LLTPWMLLASALLAACGGETAGKDGGALGSGGSGGAGGADAASDASTGGVMADASKPAPPRTDGGGSGGARCVPPPAIDPATWPSCSVVDGGVAPPAPQGVVLAESSGRTAEDLALLGERFYLQNGTCGRCVRCPPVPVVTCEWSIEDVDLCSGSRTPSASGTTYTTLSEALAVRFQFTSTADAAFWVTYGDDPSLAPDPAAVSKMGRGTLHRAARGSRTATRLRGSDGSVLRTFNDLTALGDRVYWVESAWTCDAPDVCRSALGRLVSAPATLESLPDDAITVLYDSSSSDAAPDALDLSSLIDLAADGTDLFVLSSAALHRIPLAGGPPVPITDCLAGARALAVDADHAYVAGNVRQSDGGEGPLSLVRVSRRDGSCDQLAEVGGQAFTLHGEDIYFVAPGESGCASAIRRMPRAGGAAEVVTEHSFAEVRQLAVVSDRLVVEFHSPSVAYGPMRGVVVGLDL